MASQGDSRGELSRSYLLCLYFQSLLKLFIYSLQSAQVQPERSGSSTESSQCCSRQLVIIFQ